MTADTPTTYRSPLLGRRGAVAAEAPDEGVAVHYGEPVAEQRALERRRRIDADLAALVSDAVAEGSLRSDIDPQLISRLLFGMVNSLSEWYRPRGGVGAAELADTVVAMAFDGLRAHRG